MTRSLERHIRNLDFLRPRTRGKFLFAGEEKLYVRGVTYGRFRPGEGGGEYHGPEAVERDFAQMAANGLNAVRTYTTPERWLLDAAQRHGFRVMVGLSWWEQLLASLNHDRRVCLRRDFGLTDRDRRPKPALASGKRSPKRLSRQSCPGPASR